MSQNKALCGVILVLLILCIPCDAAPSYTDWNNSKDNSTYYPDLNHSENITFNVTADEAITMYYWFEDTSAVSNNNPTYTTSFEEPFTHNISVVAHSATGNTTMITWYPVVAREVATSTPEEINETPYTNMVNSVGGEDFEGFFGSIALVFTNVMGTIFYLGLFGIYFVMVWIRQESASMPMIIGFGVGAVILGYVTESFVQGILALFVIGATAVFYSLFKERR